MSDPKVIYLGPECEDEFCDGRTWADHVAWPDCDCKHKPVRYNIGSDFDAALACEAALREENKLLLHDIASYLETTAKVCELLGIDVDAAKNADGKPSDVLFAHAQALQQRLTDAEKLFDAAVTALNEIAKVSRIGEKPFEIAILAIDEMSALKPVEGEGS